MTASKSPYKELNFPKEILESSIQEYCTANGLNFQKLPKSTANTEYYEIIKPHAEKPNFKFSIWVTVKQPFIQKLVKIKN